MSEARLRRWVFRGPGDGAANVVLAGQIGLALFTAVCVALHPGIVLKANEGGISNYGVHAKTFVFYTLALGLPGVSALVAARRLEPAKGRTHQVRRLLQLYAALILITLVTTYPYSLNTPLKDLHDAVGAVTVTFESAASVWIVTRLGRERAVLAIQLAGYVLAVLTFVGPLHLLFVAQLVTGVPFAVLLVGVVRSVEAPRAPD